jgi:hypothetical protein
VLGVHHTEMQKRQSQNFDSLRGSRLKEGADGDGVALGTVGARQFASSLTDLTEPGLTEPGVAKARSRNMSSPMVE